MSRNKAYSFLNIFGLALGMVIVMLIGLWAMKQYNYDRFLPNYKQLYQVKLNHHTDGAKQTTTSASLPLAEALRTEIPEIKHAVVSDWMGSHSLMVGENKLYIDGAQISSDFLETFPYALLKGNPKTVLKNTYSIVLTQSTAKALFGNSDPMGKMVQIDNKHHLEVTGILEDIPSTSSLTFNYLIPFSYNVAVTPWVKEGQERWTNNSFQIFVELQPNTTYAQIEPKIRNLIKENEPEMQKSEVMLHPMKDWKLYDRFENGKAAGGFVDYVHMFMIIGGLILVIACINFMNLSTARSEKRAKEVGIRKTVGSNRIELVLQFLTESVLMSLMAFVLAFLLLCLILPYFNRLVEETINIPYQNPIFWIGALLFVLFTGLLAGSRPAFYLSSFKPHRVLKGKLFVGKFATVPRKVLVVVQFTCSIALIICTLIIYKQIDHVKNRPKGYGVDQLITTDMSDDLNRNYQAVKQALLNTNMVEGVTMASSPVTYINSGSVIQKWPNKEASAEMIDIGRIEVAENYFDLLGMEFLEGRRFSANIRADSATVIVNEAALKSMGLKDAIGKVITYDMDTRATIVGVVKDALMESPYSMARPTVFIHSEIGESIMYRLKDGVDTKQALARFGEIFGQYNPAYPYEYYFVDQQYERKFKFEMLTGKLASIFAGLAVFISCLGLFGLAAYTAEQRLKEIGVRKVLGATRISLVRLLSKDFVLLVLLAFLIASPVAYYFMHRWLMGYDYHISVSWEIFLITGLLAFMVAIMTVSFQAFRAASTNPVNSLKEE
jgi:putative ABC transport system permease protein